MSNPIWQTQMNLGETPGGFPVIYQLIADPVLPASSVVYDFIGGTFPSGLTVNPNGTITGTPGVVTSITRYNFIVKATDNLGNTSNKTFSLTITIKPYIPVWNTPAGSLGNIPSLEYFTAQLSASPVNPAITVSYAIISGSLPNGLTMNEDGLISGVPTLVSADTTYTFVVRTTDNFQNISDRTFSITTTGTAIPEFTTPTGSLISVWDSTWVSLNIEYENLLPENPVTIRLVQGSLPAGLEINEVGLIRGYAEPPTIDVNLEQVITTSTGTSGINNSITCFSTSNFSVGRPVVFTGTTIGGINAGQTYYVREILSQTTFTITSSINGPELVLTSATGYMTITLPSISVGQPTIRTYSFTLKLESPLGGDLETYSITVINQLTPASQGGPGKAANSRTPTILNTRPLKFNIKDDPYYGYYSLPPNSEITGQTYLPTQYAFLGQFQSGEELNFKIIGYDFDDNTLTYNFSSLPLGLTGNSSTGWITGTPVISLDSISQYTFAVTIAKQINPSVSYNVLFSFNITNNILGEVNWVSDSDLGTIFNGTISNKSVLATSDVTLSYRVVNGALPPNLTLLPNGEITGVVSNQPSDTFTNPNTTTTFTFSIEAYSPSYPIVTNTKTFTLNVYQKYNQPTDILYIKCTPSIEDRTLIDSLLNNETIIPSSLLYRPNDPYFGKSTNVTYAHAYGIYASSLPEYLTAVTKNHYWRNITLGELSTAVARDIQGNIIYEVVYSNIIDNLINPQGISVSEEIYWPRFIDLSKGPWYTSITDIYTSYENILGQGYYTSLTPGYARILYPNSLPNMRDRVAQTLGQLNDSSLLPLWMTSQQLNGSTLGYTPAWVICYTKPGFSQTIKNNIETLWKDPIGYPKKLNKINFKIDRFSVNKSITYNYDTTLSPPTWTALPSATPVPDPLDSKDFYVLFPQETILPNESQY